MNADDRHPQPAPVSAATGAEVRSGGGPAPTPVDEAVAAGGEVATAVAPGQPTRREHDFLGSKDIPLDAYWGVHSARAVENFPISGQTVGHLPDLIRALAYVKKAAAQANAELGVIDRKRAGAIILACAAAFLT